ncbi:DUF2190 family protein [Sulfitobacter guttiformis]|uniref:Putative RecA/RadA family phage recombinase n=1 Tax=Sulfitobacter guttiformis TaxID=74349 RepID=A0A420DHA6_9RHOB|nr:capsid cement protein [Sulfitobacter guttiformis]KIN72665.1 DUF2190 domain containing protein [Sulfitobacter guttiformis KCTC 32187]RKE93606.1 putative RecA/RadA family phage recombinase [Sulfitobacter guttiformis]
MKNHSTNGTTVTLVADRDVESGEAYAKGGLIGFAQTSAAAGQQFVLVTEGVYRTTVLTVADVETGDEIFWEGAFLTSASDDGDPDAPVPYMRAGIAYIGGAAESGEAQVHVKINA